jgi:rhamnogalacturonan endolyase
VLAWEIGVPDRRAAEFRHGNEYFKSYLWRDFSKTLPNPLTFTMGRSNPARDWNYAQGSYLKGDSPVTWPWHINFQLAKAPSPGTARLTLAFASSDRARVNVRINGADLETFYPPASGGNTLLRQGIHAKYGFKHLDFPTGRLKQGTNTITLTQTRNESASVHVMYDSVSLELP